MCKRLMADPADGDAATRVYDIGSHRPVDLKKVVNPICVEVRPSGKLTNGIWISVTIKVDSDVRR